jgi:hypothetical protein
MFHKILFFNRIKGFISDTGWHIDYRVPKQFVTRNDYIVNIKFYIELLQYKYLFANAARGVQALVRSSTRE